MLHMLGGQQKQKKVSRTMTTTTAVWPEQQLKSNINSLNYYLENRSLYLWIYKQIPNANHRCAAPTTKAN